MRRRLAEIASALGSVVAPPLCWSCRRAAPAGEPLCRNCGSLLPWLAPRAPVPGGSPIAAAWSPLSYEGVARDLVHALKFSGAPGVAPAMARHLCDALPPRAFPDGAVLVPVPADPWRRRLRGFDHAAALAHALSDQVGLPVGSCLGRLRAERSGQRGLGRAERLAGRGIAVGVAGAVPPRCVLVDDVLTTGATAAACARQLRANGGKAVNFVAYSRVL